MRYVTNSFLIIIFLGVLFFSIRVSADPANIDIIIEPSEPTPLSTITFTVTIDNTSNIEEVRLIFQECQDDLCFIDKWNESMTMINEVYQTTITLIHEQATQGKYAIAVEANETWFYSEQAFIDLKIDEQHNSNENTPNHNSTPGFELVALFISMGLMVIGKRFWLKGKNKR